MYCGGDDGRKGREGCGNGTVLVERGRIEKGGSGMSRERAGKEGMGKCTALRLIE